MATMHISVSELPAEVRALIDRLRAGEEIVIDSGNEPVAILRSPERQKAKTVSELIARFEEREKELGHPILMDEDYADDMRDIIANRKPRDTSAWD